MDYVRNPAKAKYLTRAEERSLWERVRAGDLKARDAIVASYSRFVWSTVHGRWKMVPLNDRYSAGLVGLLKAIDTFDPDKGVFPPHARLYILNELREEAYLTWSIVRLKNTHRRTTRNHVLNLHLWKVKQGLTTDHLTQEMAEKAAAFFKLPVKAIFELDTRASTHVYSLNELVNLGGHDRVEGTTYEDLLTDGAPPADYHVSLFENADLLKAAMEYALNNRERYIVQTLYLSNEERSLRDCGITLGISYERVRQIQLRALQKMKLWLQQNGLKNLT